LRRGGGDEEWCLRRGGEEDDDFASTVVAKGRFLSFEPARTFVHSLKLTSQKMWEAYSKSGKRPLNIPSRPATTYRKSGWLSMPDWLGYEKKEVMAQGGALAFEAARTFVHSLKLTSQKMWEAYSKSGKRPLNIPSHPDQAYLDAGWVSYPDWLGYEGKNMMAQGGALAFEAARTFVHSLKLTSQKMWVAYAKSGKRPLNIPSHPDRTYRDAGWVSYPDWLGYAGEAKAEEIMVAQAERGEQVIGPVSANPDYQFLKQLSKEAKNLWKKLRASDARALKWRAEILDKLAGDFFLADGSVRVIEEKSSAASGYRNYNTLALLLVALRRLHFPGTTRGITTSALVGAENTVTVVDILNRWWSGGVRRLQTPKPLDSFDLCLSLLQCKTIVESVTGLKPRAGDCTHQ
jgi:hypothetical protein